MVIAELLKESLVKTKYFALACVVLMICCSSSLLQAEAKSSGTIVVAKGQRIAFLGDSITAAGRRPGGYCQLVLSALNRQGLKVFVIRHETLDSDSRRVPDAVKRSYR